MARTVVAVIAGCLFAVSLSTGTDAALRVAMPSLFSDDGYTTSVVVLLLTLGYLGLYYTFGSYLTARLAPRHPMRHALMLGGVLLALRGLAAHATWFAVPVWYNTISMLQVMFWAWIGGRMRTQELGGTAPRSITV